MADDSPKTEDRLTRKHARDSAHADAKALVDRLVSIKDEWFAAIPLDDDDPRLGEQLRMARGMKSSGARNRVIQFAARIMKDVDAAPILEVLDQLDAGHDVETVAHHVCEDWRDRIIAEGDAAIDEFVIEYPAADRQRLRQLARQALKDKAAKGPPKASRALFKVVRSHVTP